MPSTSSLHSPDEDEERLLLRLGVVEAGRLPRLEDVEPESELRKRMPPGSRRSTASRAPPTSATPLPRIQDEPPVTGRCQACAGVLESCLGHAATLPAFESAGDAYGSWWPGLAGRRSSADRRARRHVAALTSATG